nr:nucleoside-diphosphate sugar epimerase/dehydratase [Flavobacterium sp. LMO8]
MNLYEFILFYTVLNWACFKIVKSYRGIIRHSSIEDAFKLLTALSIVFISSYIINSIYVFSNGNKLFLNTYIFLNVLLSFCLLLFYRLVVKQVYNALILFSLEGKKEKIVVWGSNSNSISVVKALQMEVPLKYNVVAFLSNNNESTKVINNIPIIFVSNNFSKKIKSLGATSIIIADDSMNKSVRMQLVEDCLQNSIRVLKAAEIRELENNKDKPVKVKNLQILDLLEREPILLNNLDICNEVFDKVIFVTGAAGSIGSELVRQLVEFKPKKIILIDHAETPLHNLSLELLENCPESLFVCSVSNITDEQIMRRLYKEHRPDLVYHAAAYKHVPMMENNPDQAVITNVLGTKNLANLALEYNVKKFVMISTDKAVNPSSVMGATKRIAEKYVQSLNFSAISKTKFITTRFGNVLGSNGSVVPLFTKQIEEGGPVTITHPDVIRYFMTIHEACQLVLEAGTMGNGGEIFIFDMGDPVKIIDLARKMIRLAGLEPDKDIAIKTIGLRPGEKLYEELLNDVSITLPTHHEKITIATDINSTFAEVNEQVDVLLQVLNSGDTTALVTQMKIMVPEFVSMNSTYKELNILINAS